MLVSNIKNELFKGGGNSKKIKQKQQQSQLQQPQKQMLVNAKSVNQDNMDDGEFNNQLEPRKTVHSLSMHVNEAKEGQVSLVEQEEQIFNLDQIPPTINNVSQNLLRFTSYMGQMFEIKQQDLQLVKDTDFMTVRLDTCQ